MLDEIFENNRTWATRIKQQDPEFFAKLSRQQTPEYLWIGCSDSRVPANEIAGMMPGEIFVHRNIANLVIQTDLNCLSVMQFAVEVLKVKHIIVTGHYGCGGVAAALEDEEHGLIDNWLRNIQEVYQQNKRRIDEIPQRKDKINTLCELNVIKQAANVCRSTIVQRAWSAGQELAVHGWIYGIEDGILRNLDVSATGPGTVGEG